MNHNLSDIHGKQTESLLRKNMECYDSSSKSISISLSSGIDSSLLLGLLRKILPNKKI